jgi:hypothetical protein
MPVTTNRRLGSWKEIAGYLGRDVRTAIRWEKERGLPVHRTNGNGRPGVHSSSVEIDGWLTGATEQPPSAAAAPSAPATPNRTWRPLIIAAALALSAVSIAAGIPRFSRSREGQLRRPLSTVRTQYPLPSPIHVAVADLNGDQHADLLVTSGADFQVRIYAGEGTGAFREAIVLPRAAGLKAFRVYVADINHDNLPDLVISPSRNERQPTEVLLNRGNFHFEHAASINVHASKLAFGDFNNDGNVDLVLGDRTDSSLSIQLGDGKGGFHESARVPAEDVTGFGLVVADFNGDGKLDVANAEYRKGTGRRVSTFFGNGDGGLVAASSVAVGLAPFDLAVADLNSDGIPDLATAEMYGGVTVLLGTSDGAFHTARHYDAGAGSGSVVAADLDGDGTLDLLVLNEHSNDASVLFGRGDGTFHAAVSIPTGGYPDGGVVSDFDRDGRLDFALAATNSNMVDVHLNRTPAARHSWRLPFLQ